MSGSYQDKDGDGKVAWYPDPKTPKEKPPKGQDPKTIEDSGTDTPSADAPALDPITFGADSKPYASISSLGEATAEFTNSFTNMFGTNPPKNLISAFAKELQSLQASRSTKRITGKGGDIVIQGVSPQERQDILNKYLKTHAQAIVGAAATGDPKSTAALSRGNFGVTLTTLRNAYAENGLPMNQQSVLNAATESSLNPEKLKANLNLINLQAKTYFPALADKIDKGYTVKQLLSPYIQTRANILEEDPDMVDIKSLQSVAKDPKNLLSLYDYEVSLRQDPKWRFTKNAQDTLGGLANNIAKMFGLVG